MKSTVDISATVRPNPTVLVSLCSAISSVQSSYVGTQIKDRRMHTGASHSMNSQLTLLPIAELTLSNIRSLLLDLCHSPQIHSIWWEHIETSVFNFFRPFRRYDLVTIARIIERVIIEKHSRDIHRLKILRDVSQIHFRSNRTLPFLRKFRVWITLRYSQQQ